MQLGWKDLCGQLTSTWIFTFDSELNYSNEYHKLPDEWLWARFRFANTTTCFKFCKKWVHVEMYLDSTYLP